MAVCYRCSSRVIELWKELRRVLSDISRAGGKFGVFGPLGPLIICGDFNTKCVDLDTNSAGLPVWSIINIDRFVALARTLKQ